MRRQTAMLIKKLLKVITNCLGINFYDFNLSTKVIFVIQMLIQIINIYLLFVLPFLIVPSTYHGIFILHWILQTIFPLFLQGFVVFRSFKMRNLQKEIAARLTSRSKQNGTKCEGNFLKRITFVIIVRIIKHLMDIRIVNMRHQTQHAIAELIYASNDFMFAYFVEQLTEHVDHINRKLLVAQTMNDVRKVKNDIFEVLIIKRQILKRYSADLFATISVNFYFFVLSFYWVISRLVFGHLKSLADTNTFFYFFVPSLEYWTVFSACTKFYKKVKKFYKKFLQIIIKIISLFR